jgi:hypothetical protein
LFLLLLFLGALSRRTRAVLTTRRHSKDVALYRDVDLIIQEAYSRRVKTNIGKQSNMREHEEA